MSGSVIISGARTPIGKLSGAFGQFERNRPGGGRHRGRAWSGPGFSPAKSTTCTWARSCKRARDS